MPNPDLNNGHPLLPPIDTGTDDTAIPFDQKNHDLLLASIDRVAEQWVEQLKHVRANSEKVEALMLQRAATVKAEITQLFLLGKCTAIEAKHGDEVNIKLAHELLKMTPEERQQ